MTLKSRILRHIQPLKPIPTGVAPAGSLTPPIRAILFDVYGTLFISGSGDVGIAEAQTRRRENLQPLLSEYSIATPPDKLLNALFSEIKQTHDRLKKQGVGRPEVDIIRIWTAILNMADIEKTKAFAAEFEMIVNPVFPMPGAADLLAACRRRRIITGLISNAQFYTPLLLEWLFGADLRRLGFTPGLTFFSWQTGRAKPDPFMFRQAAAALNKMGVSASDALYVGNDIRNDIGPAAAQGFQTALFAGDARSLRLRTDDPACASVAPDLIITELVQLLSFIP